MKAALDIILRWLPNFCLLLFVLALTVGAFSGGFWASLGIGGAIITFFAVWVIDGHMPVPRRELMVFVFAFLVIVALLNLQSTQTNSSWRLLLQLTTILVPLVLFSCPEIRVRALHPKLFAVLPWAGMAGGLALGAELALGGPLQIWLHGRAQLTQYNRGLSYVVVLALPVMAALWNSRRRWVILPFIIALLIPASLTDSRAAKLALLLALLTAATAHYWPLAAHRVLTVVPFVLVSWPFVAQRIFLDHHRWVDHLPDSWRARMEIWDYMSYRILEHPWLGWGLGSSRFLSFQEPHGAAYRFSIAMPASHPHNAMIQLWVELGLPGVALGIIFSLLLLRFAVRLGPKIAPFAFGAWVAGLCLSMVSYDLWTDSLFSAFALTAFLFALLQKQIAAGKV